MDGSDLASRPLTLRTLLHCGRNNNTRGVNNRCIFHELARRSNRLSKLYLSAPAGSLHSRRSDATALPSQPIPFRNSPAFCYIPKNQ